MKKHDCCFTFLPFGFSLGNGTAPVSIRAEISPVLIVSRNRKGLKRTSGQTRFFWPSEETTLSETLRDWIKSIEFDTGFPLEKPHFRGGERAPSTICRRFEFRRSNFPPGVISARRQRTFVILLHRWDFALNRISRPIVRPWVPTQVAPQRRSFYAGHCSNDLERGNGVMKFYAILRARCTRIERNVTVPVDDLHHFTRSEETSNRELTWSMPHGSNFLCHQKYSRLVLLQLHQIPNNLSISCVFIFYVTLIVNICNFTNYWLEVFQISRNRNHRGNENNYF